MSTRSLPAVRFNVQLIVEDMVAKGWDVDGLASAAGLSQRTVYRFVSGELQTIRSGRLIAKALGRSARRYVIPTEEAAAV